MRLYNRQQSGNSYKVRLLVSQLGLACEIVDVEPLGGTRTPAFLELNPAGQAPVLELDDGRLLPESNAILWYLAEGTALLPDDAFERAQVLRWLCFEQSSVMPCLGWARWIRRRTAADHPLRARLSGYDEEGRAALAAMERWLAGRSFFAGDRYGIADIALYGYTHSAEEGGFALADYPAVAAWCRQVAEQPHHVAMI